MKKLNIFVVDDDRDFAESLAEVLEWEGHNVTMAFSGEEAVQTFQEQKFDLIFSNWKKTAQKIL